MDVTPMHVFRLFIPLLFGLSALAAAGPAATAEQAGEGSIRLELNALEPDDNGCLVTFVVENGFDTAFDEISYEMVLFDGDGLVERMVALDFSPLTPAKTRVRQFGLDGIDCSGLSRILINDAAACRSEDLAASTCIDALETSTRTRVEFGI